MSYKMDINVPKTEKVNLKAIVVLLRWFLIYAFCGVIIWKLYDSNWIIDMTKFDFNSLLALILALFSIGLSVFFYFKATDTSNSFYDNTYKFTKDVSEILGRIEAGFGERLRHLDEGYSGLRDKFTIPHETTTSQKVQKTLEEIENEKKKLEEQVKEKELILEDLLTRAKIQDQDKIKIINSLNSKENTINELNKELTLLKRQLTSSESENGKENINLFDNDLRFLIRTIIREYMGAQYTVEAPPNFISRRFRTKAMKGLTENAIHALRSSKIIDEENELTDSGLKLFRSIAKSLA